MTQMLVEQDQARGAIRAVVQRHGALLKHAAPTAIVATLVAAACMPLVWPLFGGAAVPVALKGLVALLGSTGGGYISNFITDTIERLRAEDQDRSIESETELQQELVRELLARLEEDGEDAAGLRADVAALLQRVGGVETALEAASSDVQGALAEAFAELGASFDEFGWMLEQAYATLTVIQRDQRYAIDLQRETLVKINLLLRPQLHDREVPAQTLNGASAPPVAGPPAEAADPGLDIVDASGPVPYMGLATFYAEDAEWFFGREQLVAELIVQLSETPFLAVVGPSGSGKSSLINAGLLPAVWTGRLAGATSWLTATLTPGAHPLEELAARVALLSGVAPGSLLADLHADPSRLRLAVRQVVADARAGTRLLLVVDQFEETFTLCHDDHERRQFIQALVSLLDDHRRSATVVIVVRADFYGRCAEYPQLVGVLNDNQVLVGPMARPDLRRAITGPAAHAGLDLEPGLVETVLADLGDEPGALPLLSHALFATWQQREEQTLTVAAYREAGGVRQAIARTADAVYRNLDPGEQRVVEEMFLRLTSLDGGTADTRRRVRRGELLEDEDAAGVDRLLDELAEARLLTLGEDSVEVSHEALIREWPRLREWLTEDREGLRIHRHLTEAANEWQALGRDPEALYRGVRLAGAREWAAEHQTRLNDVERQFLAASNARERDQIEAARRRNRRLRTLNGILATLLVLAVTTSAIAVLQRREAREQRDLATSRQLAAEADAAADSDPQLAARLSLAAFAVQETAEARSSLLTQLQRVQHVERFLSDHTDPVYSVAFRPDGQVLASGGIDGSVILWDVDQRERRARFPADDGGLLTVAFSPDGRTLASAGFSGSVNLWDADRALRLATLTGHNGPVYSVAFNPTVGMLASAGADGSVILWDVALRARLDTLTAQADGVLSVDFSPNGRTLAAAGIGGTVILWDVAQRTRLSTLTTPAYAVSNVAFSPDGHTLAVAGTDGSVTLWDVDRASQLGTLTGHGGGVSSVDFSPDGHTLASADVNGEVIVWDVDQARQIDTLTGHSATGVNSVAFSPEGDELASSGNDSKVILWDVGRPSRLTVNVLRDASSPGDGGAVPSVALSPDGDILASAGFDGIVTLWDVNDATRLASLTGHTGGVLSVAFSPDGRVLASASGDGSVILWDVDRATQLAVLTGHSGGVGSVAFSPDGRMLASAGTNDGDVILWDVSRRAEQATLSNPRHTGNSVAFSADGQTLAVTASDNTGDRGTVILWDVPRHRELTTLTGPSREIYRVAFSSDGRTLASASSDRTVILWDVTRQAKLATLTGHTAEALSLGFSSSQPLLASAGNNAQIIVWDVDIASWRERLCDIVDRPMSRDEWVIHVPEQPYQPTCGPTQ